MRWAAFKYGPVLLVHLVIIFICRKLTVLCMEAAGIVNETRDLRITELCKFTSSLMFSFFLEFFKNHDRKTNQSTAGIRGTANAQATSTGL